MGPTVKLIDSGAECVRDISVLLNYFEINHSRRTSSTPLFTTANAKSFAEIAETWLNKRNKCGACDLMSKVSL